MAACRSVVDVLAKASDLGVDISRTGRAVFGSQAPIPVDPSLLGQPGKRAAPSKAPHTRIAPRQRGVEPGGNA
jgi:hypothetical protein